MSGSHNDPGDTTRSAGVPPAAQSTGDLFFNPNAKLPYPRQILTPTMVIEFSRKYNRHRINGMQLVCFFGTVFALFAIGILLSTLPSLGSPLIYLLILMIAAVGAMVIYATWSNRIISRIRNRIVTEQLCLNCSYCLLHQKTNDTGIGTCPECGEPFDVKLYAE